MWGRSAFAAAQRDVEGFGTAVQPAVLAFNDRSDRSGGFHLDFDGKVDDAVRVQVVNDHRALGVDVLEDRDGFSVDSYNFV